MKELKRSRSDRMIAGVCGGLGEYLNIDANAIRLIWAVITLFTAGTGILAYLLAWLIIPEDMGPSAATGTIGGTTVTPTPADTGTVIEIDRDQYR